MKTKKQNNIYKAINDVIYNFLQDYEDELDPDSEMV